MYVLAIKKKIIKNWTHVILFVIWQKKKKKKLTREEDADYCASSNDALDPGKID
jgi:hypothetical protein